MLGWQIRCSQTTQRMGTSEVELIDGNLLASWVTGSNGLHWIDALDKEGKVERLPPGGPCMRRYSVKAKILIPIIMSLPQKYDAPIGAGDDYVQQAYKPFDAIGGYNQDVQIYQSTIDKCAPDDVLSIETLDIS